MYLMLLATPFRFSCILQGPFCDTGIPHNFYGGKIWSAGLNPVKDLKQDCSTSVSSTPCLCCLGCEDDALRLHGLDLELLAKNH